VKIRTVIFDTQSDAHILPALSVPGAHSQTPYSPQRRTTAGHQGIDPAGIMDEAGRCTARAGASPELPPVLLPHRESFGHAHVANHSPDLLRAQASCEIRLSASAFCSLLPSSITSSRMPLAPSGSPMSM